MSDVEKKIIEIEEKILTNKVKQEAEMIISEMKKIGIEKLPYSYSSLKQFIDPETMKIHYTKHYVGYVDKLNSALKKKNGGDHELEKIIKSISQYSKEIRNNAGGAFNHALFWNMLTPKEKKLKGDLLGKIIKQFKSFSNFKKEFETEAKQRFGSGWVWLVLTAKNSLKIMSTPNQDNPLMNVIEGGGFPILGLDLWEHAYYLKYQNKRDEYIANFWKVVNWDFVSKLYEMKIETRLAESSKMKQLLGEGETQMCSKEDVAFYSELFNKNRALKRTYMNGIDEILKKVFSENYYEKLDGGELPGLYNLEGPGRSVLSKLNTNYQCFCVLVNDVNNLIIGSTDRKPIDFKKKNIQEQNAEVKRFIAAINHFSKILFDRDGSTFTNIMKVLTKSNEAGKKREDITKAILKRFFGNPYRIKRT